MERDGMTKEKQKPQQHGILSSILKWKRVIDGKIGAIQIMGTVR